MAGYDRDELEQAFRAYWQAGAVGENWDAWADCFTEDADYVEHVLGCWNASPKDRAGLLGPMEEALVGTPVENLNEPVEVMRVIHSFDPCLSCAVHVINLKTNTGARLITTA